MYISFDDREESIPTILSVVGRSHLSIHYSSTLSLYTSCTRIKTKQTTERTLDALKNGVFFIFQI